MMGGESHPGAKHSSPNPLIVPNVSHKSSPRVGVLIGTRPDAIKLAPVIRELRSRPGGLETVVVASGQHRDLLDQVLRVWDITPDIDLNLMRPNQALVPLAAGVLERVSETLTRLSLDLIVVQGDTTTAFAGALAAAYHQVPVAHVEAGLRTGDAANPFPEEVNRRLTGALAAIHFAPTRRARENLMAEGVPASQVIVTGNPVVDAVKTMAGLPFAWPSGESWPCAFAPGRRAILVTLHRRESWGAALAGICGAVRDVLDACEDATVLLPVHPNPNVRGTVHRVLGSHPRAYLTDPLDHVTFLHAMQRSCVVLTDSGGVQEEAPAFGRPVLVAREVSERPEGIDLGVARVVGTERTRVATEAIALLRDPVRYAAMSTGASPYGDGRAAFRIGEALRAWARGESPLLQPHLEFGAPA